VTRKRERKQRVLAWAGWAGAGLLTAAILFLAIGDVVGAVGGAAALGVGLAFGHRHMIATPGVPILTYHSVSPDSSWLPWSKDIAVHPATLERHLATFARMGCNVISTAAFVAARQAGRTLPPNSLILHFDDGYLDNWFHAVPLLRRANMPATFFVSLDFIAPGDELRRPGGDHRGYMNWAEIRAIDADPLFEVEAHGVDHGRVPISDRQVATLNARNWRALAWVQWARTPGPKHDWFLADAPPAVPLGSPVRESEGALAAPAYVDGARETEQAFRGRIASNLHQCRAAFDRQLKRSPATFCWPENRVSDIGREVASALGYAATTGGLGRNTAAEPASILSRIHAGDRALGYRWGPAESLRIRATVRLFQGNHYWYLVSALMDLIRRAVTGFRDRFGADYA
jgi:peptidoglycan/xylan/chitin deacetylase (PgdA/CDA1 family)